MSEIPASTDGPSDELLAAEYMLRLLDPAETLAVRARENADPAFADLVWTWEARLAPLLDEVSPVVPDTAMWNRIASAVAMRGEGVNVVAMRKRVRFWRGATVGLAAIAAALAMTIAFRPSSAPPAPVPVPSSAPAISETRIAAIVSGEGVRPSPLAVVSYDPAGRSLLVTPAALPRLRGQVHELWVVPDGGTPRSLGLLTPGPSRRVRLADDLADTFVGDPTLAVSTEAAGGSPSGKPAGPIVGSGKLITI